MVYTGKCGQKIYFKESKKWNDIMRYRENSMQDKYVENSGNSGKAMTRRKEGTFATRKYL